MKFYELIIWTSVAPRYRTKPRIVMNLFDCDIFQLTTTGMYILVFLI